EMRGGAASTRADEEFRWSWRSSSIGAFYLYGQGAVFILPASSLRTALGGSFYLHNDRPAVAMQLAELESAAAALHEAEMEAEAGLETARLAAADESAAVAGVPGGVVGGVPGGVVGGVVGGVGRGVGGGGGTGFALAQAQPAPAPEAAPR